MKRKIFLSITFLALLFIAERSLACFLLGGIKRFYGLEQASEILIIGPSQTMLGVDKVLLENETNMSVSKYTREGVNVFDMHQMVVHYFQTCKQKPKLVIYGVDKYLFTPNGLSVNSYTLFYPFMDTPSVNDYVQLNASQRDYLLHKTIKLIRFNDILLGHAMRGYLGVFNNLKYGRLNPEPYHQAIVSGSEAFRKLEIDQDGVRQFRETLCFLNNQNVQVLLLCIPYAEPLNSYAPVESQKALRIFEEYATANSSVQLYLEAEMASHPEWYAEINHLNPEGQAIMTQRLAEYLRKLSMKP